MNNQIYGQAATAQGNITTTKVGTAISAPTEMRFSFKNLSTNAGGTATDIEDVFIKPACWRTETEWKPVTGDGNKNYQFTSKKWGNTPDRFFKFFQENSTQVLQIIMETDNVENYDGDLIFTKVDPTGKEDEVAVSLAPWKTESSNANGYSGRLVIPSSALSFIFGPNADIRLSKMKAGSKIDFFITISGETKTAELSPISTTIIS